MLLWCSAAVLCNFVTDLGENPKIFSGNYNCIFVCTFDAIRSSTTKKSV